MKWEFGNMRGEGEFLLRKIPLFSRSPLLSTSTIFLCLYGLLFFCNYDYSFHVWINLHLFSEFVFFSNE
jgi:hypothetical protein